MNSELSEEWRRTRLSDALETLENGSRPKGGIKEISQGIPSIGGEHLDGKGGFNFTNVRLVPKAFYRGLQRGKIRKHDVILVKDGATTGKVSIVKDIFPYDEAAVNEHLFILRGKKNILDQKFLYYHLSSKLGQRQIASSFHGAAIGGINTQFARNYTMLLPTLPTQKRIASMLERVQEAMGLRDQANELTSVFLESIFIEMFGNGSNNPMSWPIKTISELCEEIVDCPHSTPAYSEEITPYACIRTSELKNGYIDWTSMKYLNERDYKERTRRLVPMQGDVIYGREGTFGEAVIVPGDTRLCLGQRVMLFRPNCEICTPEFLWAMVRSKFVYNQALKVTNGSTVGHVNVKEITKFRVFCPPLKLQQRFSSVTKSVQSLRERQADARTNIEKLMAASLQNSFKEAVAC